LMSLRLAPFGDDLLALELHHCEGLETLFQHSIPARNHRIDSMTIGISYSPETIFSASDTLSHITRSVGQGLTIVFDGGEHLLPAILSSLYRCLFLNIVHPDSPPLFAFAPFSHLRTLRLSFTRPPPTKWLEAALASIILNAGITLYLSFTAIFDPHRENTMHNMLCCIPSLRLQNHTTYSKNFPTRL
jgi:hypothetical protein